MTPIEILAAALLLGTVVRAVWRAARPSDGALPVRTGPERPPVVERVPRTKAPAADPRPSPTGEARYLLSARPPAGTPDRTAAMLGVLAGPGLCTPIAPATARPYDPPTTSL